MRWLIYALPILIPWAPLAAEIASAPDASTSTREAIRNPLGGSDGGAPSDGPSDSTRKSISLKDLRPEAVELHRSAHTVADLANRSDGDTTPRVGCRLLQGSRTAPRASRVSR
jgi:hypothetical protein